MSRPWTDEEIGFLQEHEDWKAPRVAEELGRSAVSIRGARQLLRKGKLGAQTRIPWSEEEDAVLIEAAPWVTAAALASVLAGRSVNSVHHRRQKLGLEQRGAKPYEVCGRPLLAKTCLGCDLLLAGSWFSFQKAQNGWASYCRACNSKKSVESKERGVGRWTADDSRAAREKYQRITLPHATRRGEPYTEADYAVLKDVTLTDLQKALRLKRTYGAVGMARRNAGFKSKPDGLGDPERDVWVIHNPNLDSLGASA